VVQRAHPDVVLLALSPYHPAFGKSVDHGRSSDQDGFLGRLTMIKKWLVPGLLRIHPLMFLWCGGVIKKVYGTRVCHGSAGYAR